MPSTSIKSLKRSTVIVLVICCVATLAALLIYDHPAPPDPIYKGQPLSEGLSMVGIRLHGWEWEINGATPSKALQAIGTNALPLIISELRVRDSRLRIWLQETLDAPPLRRIGTIRRCKHAFYSGRIRFQLFR
jgi:hypothetical protein